MAKFTVTQSVKCTIWRNYEIEIEADSLDEAKKKAIEKYGNKEAQVYTVEDGCDVYSTELIDSTETTMSPEENGGGSTIELYYSEESMTKPFHDNSGFNTAETWTVSFDDFLKYDTSGVDKETMNEIIEEAGHFLGNNSCVAECYWQTIDEVAERYGLKRIQE